MIAFDANSNLVSETSLSSDILNRVEKCIVNHEHRIGRKRLLKIVWEIPYDVIAEHVVFYRQIIRGNVWPNEPLKTSFEQFLSDYASASLAYANIAFELLEEFPWSDDRKFQIVYQKALGAEALRGQFGKRCVTGLDYRLDAYVEKIEELLTGFFPEENLQIVIDILCAPTEPALSAESALLEDFLAVQQIFPKAPTFAEVVCLKGEGEETIWRFLRRHCRWSLQLLHRYYHQFDGPLFASSIALTRKARAEQLLRKSEILTTLGQVCSSTHYDEAANILHAINCLNHLNLTLEPLFSFKGSPGFVYGLAFRRGQTSKLTGSFSQSQICEMKWQLFACA